MQKTRLAALLAPAAAMLTACAGAPDEPSAGTPPVPVTVSPPTVVGLPAPTRAAQPTTVSPPPVVGMPAPTTLAGPLRRLRLTVRGGEVTGDTGLVQLRVGERTRLTVTSNTGGRVHIDGPGGGFTSDLPAGGGTGSVDFTPTVPGRLEVKLEAGRTLAVLQVR